MFTYGKEQIMQTTAPKSLTKEQGDILLAALAVHTDTEAAQARSYRNVLAATLMLDAGLRIGEVLQLTIADLVISAMPAESLRIRAEITKTKTERIIPLTARIRTAIDNCYRYFWIQPQANGSRRAFTLVDRFEAVTPQHLERIIKAAGRMSLHSDIHPHMLRHTFATRLMRTVNARVVQQLLGHKRMTSTQIYMHPDQKDLDDAIKTLE